MILKKVEIQNEIINLITNEVNKYKSKMDTRGIKNKYEYKTFINAFIIRLKTSNTWEHISEQSHISKTHLNRVFIEWSDANIFQNAYKQFLNKYNLFIDNNEVYIDSTIIMNKYGTRNTTGYNTYECKKHRSNKISVIASRNGIPLGIHVSNSNVHDINLLLTTLPKRTLFNKLYGDKGYISKYYKNKLKRNRNIDFVTPFRKNQKHKLNDIDKLNIKNRIRIEHFNALIKQNKCINIRYDRYLEPYIGLVYLGCINRGLQIVFNFLYNF